MIKSSDFELNHIVIKCSDFELNTLGNTGLSDKFFDNASVNEEAWITFDGILSTQCSYSYSTMWVSEDKSAKSGTWTNLEHWLYHSWPYHSPTIPP